MFQPRSVITTALASVTYFYRLNFLEPTPPPPRSLIIRCLGPRFLGDPTLTPRPPPTPLWTPHPAPGSSFYLDGAQFPLTVLHLKYSSPYSSLHLTRPPCLPPLVASSIFFFSASSVGPCFHHGRLFLTPPSYLVSHF